MNFGFRICSHCKLRSGSRPPCLGFRLLPELHPLYFGFWYCSGKITTNWRGRGTVACLVRAPGMVLKRDSLCICGSCCVGNLPIANRNPVHCQSLKWQVGIKALLAMLGTLPVRRLTVRRLQKPNWRVQVSFWRQNTLSPMYSRLRVRVPILYQLRVEACASRVEGCCLRASSKLRVEGVWERSQLVSTHFHLVYQVSESRGIQLILKSELYVTVNIHSNNILNFSLPSLFYNLLFLHVLFWPVVLL